MSEMRYLVIGSGMTGHAAAAAIREVDPGGRIEMVGADPERPYARPPLSKGLWFGKPEESVWLADIPGLELLPGTRIVSIDVAARAALDERGKAHPYDRLLLATGGTPRRLPFGGERVVYFRTLSDFRRLRAVTGRRAVVLGGGFIGSEVAAALASNGREVAMVFPEAAIGARSYPADLAAFVTRTFEEKGVRLHASDAAVGIEPRGEETLVRTRGGAELVADVVVAGLGIVPDLDLARGAGILCENGIVVSERLETSAPGVFAAGDVACLLSEALGGHVRVEHEDAALTTGRCAGRNMAGVAEPYAHLPFFYSDLFDLGYEAVGRLDSRLETVCSWKKPYREGIVYYLEGDRVRGVLLWGTFGQVDAARALLGGRGPVSRDALQDAIRT